MRTALNMMLNTSKDLGNRGIDNYRQNFYVLSKIVEEIGEIREELDKAIAGQEEGKDGIGGEAVDLIINLIDLYSLQVQHKLSPEEIEKKINKEIGASLENHLRYDVHAVEDNGFSLSEELFKGLIYSQMNISIHCQVADGLSYKVRTEEKFLEEILVAVKDTLKIFWVSQNIDNIFHLSEEDIAISEETEYVISLFNKTVYNKVNKWRKIRDLTLF